MFKTLTCGSHHSVIHCSFEPLRTCQKERGGASDAGVVSGGVVRPGEGLLGLGEDTGVLTVHEGVTAARFWAAGLAQAAKPSIVYGSGDGCGRTRGFRAPFAEARGALGPERARESRARVNR